MADLPLRAALVSGPPPGQRVHVDGVDGYYILAILLDAELGAPENGRTWLLVIPANRVARDAAGRNPRWVRKESVT